MAEATRLPRPRVVFEDPDLPHQIVLRLRGGSFSIAVSCNCLRRNGSGRLGAHEPIEVRDRWDARDAIAAWRAHVQQARAAS